MNEQPGAPNCYDAKNIYMLESVYGRGYLSPGGDDEVTAIIENTLPVADKAVLDLGCGLGGSSIALAKKHKAKHVTATDIDPVVLARATELVNAEKLEQLVTLIKIDAGPLPFNSDSFDVVYMTAVSCHIQDLVPFLKDVHRVLVHGGSLIGIEWLIGGDTDSYRGWDQLLRTRGLNFYFVREDVFRQSLAQAGFCAVSLHDRTNSMAELTTLILNRVRGELRTDLEGLLGSQGYRDFEQWCAVRAAALGRKGALMHQFCAKKAG